GEWGGVQSITESLDALRPDRVDHGIAAADDPRLLERLVEEATVLWVAPTSNVVTGAVGSLEAHPLARLLDAGVSVAIGADDPLFFRSTTAGELAVVQEAFGFGERTMRRFAENAWRGAFCSEAERHRALADLGHVRLLRGGDQPSVFS
ncbi:MAG: adenosine deaminase, partial [Acidobacteriota bacterium]